VKKNFPFLKLAVTGGYGGSQRQRARRECGQICRPQVRRCSERAGGDAASKGCGGSREGKGPQKLEMASPVETMCWAILTVDVTQCVFLVLLKCCRKLGKISR